MQSGTLETVTPPTIQNTSGHPDRRDDFLLLCPQVSVALSSSSIRVAMLEENGERVLMEGKLTHKINTESSLWSLEPGKCVLVSLGTCVQGSQVDVKPAVMPLLTNKPVYT